MPHLIRPNITKVVTKEGEIVVHIAIDLNLNLNADGVQAGVSGVQAASKPQKDEDEVDWAIPDFKMPGNIKFGEEKE